MLDKGFFIFRNENGKLLPIKSPYVEKSIEKGKVVEKVLGYISHLPFTIGKINELAKIERVSKQYSKEDLKIIATAVFEHAIEPKFESVDEIINLGQARIGNLFKCMLDNSSPKLEKEDSKKKIIK